MLNKLYEEEQAVCLLVEVIAKRSQNIPWRIRVDNEAMSKENIRRVSIDKFYEIATGEKEAFLNLCQVLPRVIDDVLEQINMDSIIQNTVLDELKQGQEGTDILKTIYQTSFATYEGFSILNWR